MIFSKALVSIFFLFELSAHAFSDDGDKQVFTDETWLSSIIKPTNLVETHVLSHTYEVTTQNDTDEGPSNRKWINWWNSLTTDFERNTGRRIDRKFYEAQEEIIANIIDWTNLCNSFEEKFGLNVCESENGWARRNQNGRRQIEVLETEDEDSRDMVISNNAHRGHNHENARRVMVIKTENKDYSISDALDHLNYCSAGAFKIGETIQKYVQVSVHGLNWREAVKKVMDKAKDMRISVDNYDHAMIVLPNSVDFEGSLGKGMLISWFSVMPEEAFYDRTIVLHELGHNLGLKHSRNDIEVYGGADKHCIMGDPGHDKNACFNGRNTWFLGYYKNDRVTVQPHKFHQTLMIDLHVYLQQGAHNNQYVVVRVEHEDMNIYVMYYANQNVMSITKGDFGGIESTRTKDDGGEEKLIIPYAKDSYQISEIGPGSKYTYRDFVFAHHVDVNSNHYLLTYPTSPPTPRPTSPPTYSWSSILTYQTLYNMWGWGS